MTETIKLMKSHTSVRRFKEQALPQEDLTEILTAAQTFSCQQGILTSKGRIDRTNQETFHTLGLECIGMESCSLFCSVQISDKEKENS